MSKVAISMVPLTDNYLPKLARQSDKRKKHVTCIVQSCRSKSIKSDLRFFKFPKNPIKTQTWIDSIGLDARQVINKNNYVCQKHFIKEHITSSNYLIRNAVPILNIEKTPTAEEDNVQLPCNFTNIDSNQHSPVSAIIKPSVNSCSTQTDKQSEDVEFLQLINSLNCDHCVEPPKFEPSTFQKMNVKLAAQLLSSTVAAAIKTTLQIHSSIFGNSINDVIPTAHFVQKFNDMFDALNCRSFSSSAPYEKPLKIDNNIYEILERSLLFLGELKIISKNENYFKFIRGFKISINAHLSLINILNTEFGVDYLLTGRTSQDCLENFFSVLRGKGGFNFMPSSHEIGIHFANIVVRKITLNSPFQNCISGMEEGETINLDWDSLKADYEMSLKSTTDTVNIQSDEVIEEAAYDILKTNAITYFAGYCILKKINCTICKAKLLKEGEIINITESFLREKNFAKLDSNFGSLTAPSPEFIKIAESLVMLFEKHYQHNCSSGKIVENLTNKCMEMVTLQYSLFMPDFNDICYEHKKLISFFILVLLRKNCRWAILNNHFVKKNITPMFQ